MLDLVATARAARVAGRQLAALGAPAKESALRALADALLAARSEIVAASRADVAAASTLPSARQARLLLDERGVDRLAAGVRQLADLPDPVGRVSDERTVPSGLRVARVRSPLGVVCMIYEARPGVAVDAFALCFKAGNACILKGGREAAGATAVLVRIVRRVLAAAGLPEAAVTDLSALERERLPELLALRDHIDLVIPRGGEPLIRFVAEHSRIPTIQHFRGVCHVYVDAAADLDIAENLCVNGKVSAPATCNATECVLVHSAVAGVFVPRLLRAMSAKGVDVRACPRTLALAGGAACVPATPDDFGREFLDLVLAVKVVDSLDAALDHIAAHGSDHTEAIATRDAAAADEFARRCGSSCVLINAGTRFNDGFELGLGAEIGISTSRLHAYGPMGLEDLTIRRWVVRGDGHVRA